MASSAEHSTTATETKPWVILNDFHASQPQPMESSPQFTLFSDLPTELCLKIWTHTLQKNRIVGIYINDKDDNNVYDSNGECDDFSYVTRNTLGNLISGEQYKLHVTSNHQPSPLFQVNRQSRQAALAFYRVHIPVDLHAYGEKQCLYLNPEFDFWHLQSPNDEYLLVDFIHDAKAYDPLGVGVLNLVIGDSTSNTPIGTSLPMKITHNAPEAISSFKTTITNLQHLIFHQVCKGETRLMFNSLNMSGVHYNRSFPLYSQTEAFDLLESDPRPIDPDLEKLSIGWDPRSMLSQWREMETIFGIHRSNPLNFQFLITAPTYGSLDPMKIRTRRDVDEFLGFEKEYWASQWEPGSKLVRWGYENPDTEESLEKAPMPVVGFWLFDGNAFGNVPEGKFGDVQWSMKEVVNVTEHRPKLGVFHLLHGG